MHFSLHGQLPILDSVIMVQGIFHSFFPGKPENFSETTLNNILLTQLTSDQCSGISGSTKVHQSQENH